MKLVKFIGMTHVIFAIMILSAQSICAVEYYVSPSGNCLNDGLTPSTPKKTITCALNVAYPGDIIHIAAGTYNLALGEVFPIQLKPYKHNDGVSLIGENVSTTFIDATGAGRTAVEIDNNTYTLNIENLTIQNVNSVGGVGIGIGITNSSGVTVRNCAIKNNISDGGGAGMSCWGSDALIDNNLFEGNRVLISVNDGGGLLITNCSPTVTNNTFRNNYAGAGGGGIHCLSMLSVPTNPLIENNLFINNEAGYGGGISVHFAKNPVLRNNIILNNTAQNAGGGIFVYGLGTSPLIESNFIAGNHSLHTGDSGGAIKASPGSSPVIKNCLIINNVSESHAGAIFCQDANLTVTNCTLYNNDGKASTTDGIWFWGGSGTISYSILWENLGSDVMVQGGATVSIHHSNFEDTPPAGTGNFSSDPKFVTGPFSPPPLGDFYLAKDASEGGLSPCVNAGDVTADSVGLSIGRTTRTDGIWDDGMLDLGFHYLSTIPTPTPSPTPSPTPTKTPVPVLGDNYLTVMIVLSALFMLCIPTKIRL